MLTSLFLSWRQIPGIIDGFIEFHFGEFSAPEYLRSDHRRGETSRASRTMAGDIFRIELRNGGVLRKRWAAS